MPPRLSRAARAALIVLAVLAAAALLLPRAVKAYVNRVLGRVPGYKGHVDRVRLHPWRGAYQIRGVKIEKTSGDVPVPLFSADRIDLSVEWRALLKGALVGEIALRAPRVNLVLGGDPDGPAEARGPGAQTGTEGDAERRWTDAVKDLFPLRINRFSVTDGEVRLRDLQQSPPLDFGLTGLQLDARNLTNSDKISESLMADLRAHGRLTGGGTLHVGAKLDPLADQPAFNVDLAVTGMDVTRLNPLLDRQVEVEMERGRLDLFIECAAADGAFKGYVKPLIRDLRVKDKRGEGLGQAVKEGLAKLAAALIRNRRQDTVATRVEFAGRLDGPRMSAWRAVFTAFRHAFIQALQPQLDNSVALRDVKK